MTTTRARHCTTWGILLMQVHNGYYTLVRVLYDNSNNTNIVQEIIQLEVQWL